VKSDFNHVEATWSLALAAIPLILSEMLLTLPSIIVVQQARLWLQSLRWPAFLEPEERYMLPLNNLMSVEEALHLIARAGALALRRPDLGAIKVGAKADLVVFRTDSSNMIGPTDPVTAIILHSDVGDIEDVLVGGKLVKRNGRLVHPEYKRMSAAFGESTKMIQEIWAQTDWQPLENSPSGGYAPLTPALIIDVKRDPGTGY
jgi:predicted amidohydrolase